MTRREVDIGEHENEKPPLNEGGPGEDSYHLNIKLSSRTEFCRQATCHGVTGICNPIGDIIIIIDGGFL